VRFRCVEVEEELVHLIGHLVDAGIGAVDLVDHNNGGEVQRQRLRQHVTGLGHGAFGSVNQKQDSVDEGKGTLHLATKVGVPGGVDQVDLDAVPFNGGGLGEDRDAAFALLVAGVHDPVHGGFVRREDSGRRKHRINEGCLAVVDVRDQGHIAE
jgi:hypothetical protein